MKKNKLFIGISMCTLMLAVGCSKDEEFLPSGNSSTETVSINVNSTLEAVGGSPTRATLASDAITPIWEREDKIAAIVDNGTPVELSLSSGAGSDKGSFSGDIPAIGEKMYFYYPVSAATTVDLTKQDGSNTKEMVMFASANYSTTPSIAFQNKTSILKLNMPVPAESSWNESTKLSATIYGAYSKGKLTTEGKWSDLCVENISVSNIKVSNGKLTGYVVVIPGTKVTDLRIAVTDGSTSYVTNAYTNTLATVPENNVVAINRATTKALVWAPGTIKANDVKSFLGTDGTDLIIVASGEMEAADFTELREALKNYNAGTINLTLLNQTTLPDIAFSYANYLSSASVPNVTSVGKNAFFNCDNITSISLPNAENVGEGAFRSCDNLTSVSLPKVKSVNNFTFYGCQNLTSICLPNAKEVGKYFVSNCTSLTYLSLPKVTRMGVVFNAFSDITKSNITLFVNSEADWYGNESDWKAVYKEGMSVLTWIPGETKAANVTSYIAANGNTLPIFSAQDLGPADFTELTSALKDIDAGSVSITLFNQTTLPDKAFNACYAISFISAPKATSIGKRALERCSKLTTVSFPEVISVDEEAFFSSGIQSLTLPKAKTLGKDAIAACKSLSTISMPEVETIGEEAFGMSNMKSVSLPKATSVGQNAFYNCSRIKSIELPEAISVGKSAFSSCIELETISLPNAITVESNAFNSCKVLKYLYLQSATTVASDAFTKVDKSKINVYVKRGTNWWNPWTDWSTVSEK